MDNVAIGDWESETVKGKNTRAYNTYIMIIAHFIETKVRGLFGNYWDISLKFIQLKVAFMKFHHILNQNKENKWTNFQLHHLGIRLLPRVRTCQWKRSSELDFWRHNNTTLTLWVFVIIYIIDILLLFSIFTDAVLVASNSFSICIFEPDTIKGS